MQPPPGYQQNPQFSGPSNQGPQQYPAGPQGYQHPPQQYGMTPPPYYPPQKKGMPGWAIALIVCGAGFVFLVLVLAAIPMLVSTNTRDARRAEGEQLLAIKVSTPAGLGGMYAPVALLLAE